MNSLFVRSTKIKSQSAFWLLILYNLLIKTVLFLYKIIANAVRGHLLPSFGRAEELQTAVGASATRRRHYSCASASDCDCGCAFGRVPERYLTQALIVPAVADHELVTIHCSVLALWLAEERWPQELSWRQGAQA